LLRATVGIAAMAEAFFAIAADSSPLVVAIGLSAALMGIALILGILTPVASALLSFGSVLLMTLPAVALHLLSTRMALFEYVVMAATLAVVGPGATSLDARIFGHREVAIAERHPADDP
jgi:uncharacterized membrane protein YphA (DoxX/SURF4 family)